MTQSRAQRQASNPNEVIDEDEDEYASSKLDQDDDGRTNTVAKMKKAANLKAHALRKAQRIRILKVAKIKLHAASKFLQMYKQPYAARTNSIQYFSENFFNMHEQIIAGCKKAVRKCIIYCWNKDLETNLIRDNRFLENYETEYEDDKVEKAIETV